MSEIKSCPANESHKPVMFFKRDVGGQAYRIECGYCGCQVVMPTREAAIAAWNAGRDPAKLEGLLEAVTLENNEEVPCPNCGTLNPQSELRMHRCWQCDHAITPDPESEKSDE